MFFEMLMEISTIFTTIVFLTIRIFDRGAWNLDLPTGEIRSECINSYVNKVLLIFIAKLWCSNLMMVVRFPPCLYMIITVKMENIRSWLIDRSHITSAQCMMGSFVVK